jgi:hypothetical protein
VADHAPAEPAPDATDGADAGPDAVPDAALDGGAPALQFAVEPEVGWSHQTGPVALGAAANRACFLVGVSGEFSGAAEVRILIQAGSWIIDGTAPGALAGVARCVTWSAASGLRANEVYDWSKGQPALDMGPATNRLCALTRMAGSFVGGGEMIRAAISGGRWLLDGAALSAGAIAGARCLTWPATANITVGDEVLWANGQASQDLGVVANRACMLMLIAGGFAGFGERISLTVGGNHWILDGAGAQSGVAARARCATWL